MSKLVKVKVTHRAIYLNGEVARLGDVVAVSPADALAAVEANRAVLVGDDMAALAEARRAATRRQVIEAKRAPDVPDVGPEWSSMR